MPINKTPKRVAKAAQPQYNDIYTALKDGESEITPKTNDGPDVAGQLADLIKRVDQISHDNSALRMQQVHVQHQPQVQQQRQEFLQVQEEEMPDPVLNPKEYGKWIDLRIDKLTKAGIDAYKQSQQETNQSSSAYEKLWDDFTAIDGNEGWEKEPEKVQVASLKVAKKIQAKGLDPQKYMLQNSDMFFKDLKEVLEADFGKPDEEEGEEEAVAEDEVDRTAGLMGGQPAPVNKAKPGSAGNPDMFGDLSAIQRKGGWY